MSITYSIDSVQGMRLEKLIKQRISTMGVDEEEVEFISQYIKAMIVNQKSANEIALELQPMFGEKFNSDFAFWAIGEAQKIESPPALPTAPKAANNKTFKKRDNNHKFNSKVSSSIPVRDLGKIAGAFERLQQSQNGFQNGDQNSDVSNGLNKLPPGKFPYRCRHFPTCTYPGCVFSHPSEDCPDYPNCPRGSQCCFLHPEDKTKLAKIFPVEQAKMVCKFKDKCANKDCQFGHPTPVNNNATVVNKEWCADGLSCANQACDKAHPSASNVRPPAPLPEKKILDCKFGMNCANFHCKFRHARSPIVCRNGAACDRPDCLFSHPLEENCRFDVNCTNNHCLYKHPNGKVNTLTVNSTGDRQFAANEASESIQVAPNLQGDIKNFEQGNSQSQSAQMAPQQPVSVAVEERMN